MASSNFPANSNKSEFSKLMFQVHRRSQIFSKGNSHEKKLFTLSNGIISDNAICNFFLQYNIHRKYSY